MNHLDEGTIHAWLDGALDAAQSREIEAHVAGCTACSASVAEARGLIAGASRILAALDDVPAGVIPGGAPAAPGTQERDGVTPIAARRDIRRGWRITSWASGIAAVLVGAIVLSTTNRADRSMDSSRAQKVVITDTSVAGLSPVTAAAGNDDAAAETPMAERREALPAPPVATPAPAIGSGVATGRAAADTRTKSVAANQAKQPAPPLAKPPVERRITPAFGDITGAERAAPAAPQDSTRMRVARVDSTLMLESVAVSVSSGEVPAMDVSRFAGCYRLEPPRDAIVGVAKGSVADAPVSRRGAASSAAAPSVAAPSRAAAAQKSELSARGLPAVVRLDTVRAGPGHLVRLPSDSGVGSWRVVGDSVLVDLGPRGSVTLSARQRVDCPQSRD